MKLVMMIIELGDENVDIPKEIIVLQFSQIRKLCDNFHKWKLIPLYLIEKSLGNSYKFHSNVLFKNKKTKFYPIFLMENCFK